MSVFDQQFRFSSSCFGFGEKPLSARSQNSPDLVTLDPADEQKKKEIDNALSEAMTNLSFEERQEQLQVLHGVDDRIDEESTLINHSLEELGDWLQKTKAGTIYEQAESIDPGYVNSRSFRIMFLRGNRYDVKAAADQMLRFFQAKQEIFGMDKLVKDITINDLDQDDRECLKTGFMQVIGRDSSNRNVMFEPPGLRNFKDLRNVLRAQYYIIMKILQSEETQLRGAVVIPYMMGEFQDKGDKGGVLSSVRLGLALPLYIASIHLCCDRAAGYVLFSVAVNLMPAKLRARFQIHYGSHLEVQYRLSSYGIPGRILPITQGTHSIKLENHLKWYGSCLGAEASLDDPSVWQEVGTAVQPTQHDVLYVDGKTSNNTGNNILRSLVKENEEAYQTGNRKEKRILVDAMIAEIQGSGGRFLKHAKELEPPWAGIPLAEAQTKIKQMFRNHKQTQRHKQPQEDSSVGTRIPDEPRPGDVVCGKGNNSPGVVFLRKLVRDRTEEYDGLDRGKKALFVDMILQQTKGEGGRFLLPDLDGWIEMSDEAARKRISKCFRNNRRYASNKSKPQ